MTTPFAIKVYKEYFNFACSHFVIFGDGTREPLHGHNYRVRVQGRGNALKSDMVFDFLHLKPLVRDLCNSLDHKLLLPAENIFLKFEDKNTHWRLLVDKHTEMVLPKSDILILPIQNTTAERLAIYLAQELTQKIKDTYNYKFNELEIEVEETPGQSAVFVLKE
jgi:6-pyruvoyltetrahydropterin/6-carboxytetrahydropterin synthase